MDIKSYVREQMDNVHRHVDDVMKDITEEQLNWQPVGTLNPISTIYLHMLTGEDYFVQSVIQGESLCWVAQDWGEKIGVRKPPEQGRSWDEFKTTKLLVAPMLAYQQAVRGNTYRYLDRLTAEELDRSVNFGGRELPVAEVLMTLVVHSAGHAGEIAAVKGMQGIKGLPY